MLLTVFHEWSLSLCVWWLFQWVLNSGNAITIFNRVNFRWACQQSHFSVLLLSTRFNKYLPHQITIYPRRELTTSRLRAKWSNKSKSCGNWPHDDSASDIICKAWQRIFGNRRFDGVSVDQTKPGHIHLWVQKDIRQGGITRPHPRPTAAPWHVPRTTWGASGCDLFWSKPSTTLVASCLLSHGSPLGTSVVVRGCW